MRSITRCLLCLLLMVPWCRDLRAESYPWITRNPLPGGVTLGGMAQSPGLMLAVSGSGPISTTVGELFSSTDGLTWRRQFYSAPEVLGRELQWTGREFVSSPVTGDVLTSVDGKVWTRAAAPLPPATNARFDFAWNGSLYVAAGGKTGVDKLLTSPDFITWTDRTPNGLGYRQVEWTGTHFVAPANGFVSSSPDGITWTVRPVPDLKPRLLSWNGSVLMCMGYSYSAAPDGGTAWTASQDGSTWRAAGVVPGSTGIYFYDLQWTGSTWLACGNEAVYEGKPLLAESPDGTAWTVQEQPVQINKLQIRNGSVLGAGKGGVWSRSGSGEWEPQFKGVTGRLRALAQHDGLVVAVGDNPFVLTSRDGRTWTERPLTIDPLLMFGGRVADSVHLRDIIWAEGRFVAAGDVGCFVSADGTLWQHAGGASFNGVAWNGQRFIATTESGDFWTSLDGLKWRWAGWLPMADSSGIVWTGSRFAVSGSEGIATSIRGEEWTMHTDPNDADNPGLRRISMAGGRVVSGGNFRSAWSDDGGATWTFLAPGLNGGAASDGVRSVGIYFSRIQEALLPALPAENSQISLQTSMELFDAIWTGTQFIVVGDAGTILTSGPPDAPVITRASGSVHLTWNRFSNFDQYSVEQSANLFDWSSAGPDLTDTLEWTGPELPRAFYRVIGR